MSRFIDQFNSQPAQAQQELLNDKSVGPALRLLQELNLLKVKLDTSPVNLQHQFSEGYSLREEYNNASAVAQQEMRRAHPKVLRVLNKTKPLQHKQR